MDSGLALLILAVGLCVGLYGVWRFPRYAVQPLAIGRAWHLLDDFDRSVRHGELPCNDPCVHELREKIYMTARVSDRITIVDILVAWRHPDDWGDGGRQAWSATPENLSPAERQVYHHLDFRLRYLLPFIVFSGSWLGIGALLVRGFPFAFRVLVKRDRSVEPSADVFDVSARSIDRRSHDNGFGNHGSPTNGGLIPA